jgi:hypothetical protein
VKILKAIGDRGVWWVGTMPSKGARIRLTGDFLAKVKKIISE